MNEYTLADEEVEMKNLMNLMSIYTIYYNTQNNTQGHLFTNINPYNKHSTNDKLMELITHIRLYKSQPDVKLDIKEGKYKLEIEKEDSIYCQLLIPLLLILSKRNWMKLKWNIIST